MEIIGIIVASLGLLAALWAAREAKRAADIEIGRDELAFAAGVHAWIGAQIRTDGRTDYGMIVSNTTSNPVFDVVIDYHLKNSATAQAWAVLPPGVYFAANYKNFPKPIESLDIQPQPIMNSRDIRVTGMQFTDANMVRWARDEHGALSKGPATRPEPRQTRTQSPAGSR